MAFAPYLRPNTNCVTQCIDDAVLWRNPDASAAHEGATLWRLLQHCPPHAASPGRDEDPPASRASWGTFELRECMHLELG